MKNHAVVCGLVASITLALGVRPTEAQFGGLTGALNKAVTVKKIADVRVTDAEEQQIGQQVSDKVVETFGVYQDAAVTRYVTLVGAVLVQASARPSLNWQFVVLDTEGVNAFAAPGGFIHITKGLLGLMKNEAELAGVLAHEILHVTEKHTVNAIQKSGMVQVGTDEIGSAGMAGSLVSKLADAAYSNILNNRFSRDDEVESDEKGVVLANSIGYAPSGLITSLRKLSDRNKDAKEPNGMFASHPLLTERITKIESTIKSRKLAAAATVDARYGKNITFDAKPATAIATVAEGSRGLAGSEGKKAPEKTADAAKPKTDAATKEEPKKSGGMLSRLRPGGGKQAEQSQTVASAGARGVNPDRDAVGGPNKQRVPVKIGPNDIAEFRKGIA